MFTILYRTSNLDKKLFDFNDEVLSFAKIIDPKVVFFDKYPSLVPLIHRLCPGDELEQCKYWMAITYTIIYFIVCVPHSSACAERMFSQLSLIKTKNRKRPKVNECNALYFIPKSCYEVANPDEQLLSKGTKPNSSNIYTSDDDDDADLSF